jgi:hypothetical protein
MGWDGHIGRLMRRRRSIVRAVIVCLCGVALVLGALPGAVPGASAASHPDEITLRASTVVETDRSKPSHPCKRGAVAAPIGACAAAGFAAGLAAAGVEHMPPAATGAQPGLRPYASLAHQWRGYPPDRPPRS